MKLGTWIAWVSNLFPNGGYYVEAGAHDGVGDSQTKALEDSGIWQGLCVEPSSAFRGLKKSRSCRVDNRCLWKENGTVDFCEVSGNQIELSGISTCFQDHWDRSQWTSIIKQVECTTLAQVLTDHNAPNIIELLCLDTEGSEYDILNIHDFDRFFFRAMAIEHNGVKTSIERLRELLLPRYDLVENDGIQDYYVQKGFVR